MGEKKWVTRVFNPLEVELFHPTYNWWLWAHFVFIYHVYTIKSGLSTSYVASNTPRLWLVSKWLGSHPHLQAIHKWPAIWKACSIWSVFGGLWSYDYKDPDQPTIFGACIQPVPGSPSSSPGPRREDAPSRAAGTPRAVVKPRKKGATASLCVFCSCGVSGSLGWF